MGGPRAERPEIAQEYYEELPEFALRLQTKAGLTGYTWNAMSDSNRICDEFFDHEIAFLNNYQRG